jgi:Polyglycine hydrolase-like, structural repeat
LRWAGETARACEKTGGTSLAERGVGRRLPASTPRKENDDDPEKVYQAEFNTQLAAGLLTRAVTGYNDGTNNAHFAALWTWK